MIKKFDFNVGDKVWLMYNDSVICGTISSCFYKKFISCVDFESIIDNERYYVDFNGKTIGDYSKEEFFRTKEDLIKSL